MKILGIHIGELSTAALMIDGVVVAAAHEERFSRLKSDERYPMQAIDYCLEEAGIQGRELDTVAIAGLQSYVGSDSWLTREYSTFSIADHIKAQREYWYPMFYEGKSPVWIDLFRDKIDLNQFPCGFSGLLHPNGSFYGEDNWKAIQPVFYKGISDHLGVPVDRITQCDHHTCHAAYAYWGSPFRDGKTLVLTADAYGDGLSATISVAEDGAIKRIHAVHEKVFRLARLYRYITLLLGMKPNQHEYKVMGLAAYAKPETLKASYELFKSTMAVDGLNFKWGCTPTDMYFWFRDRLEGQRFDGIAGGLQKYTEEILGEWVRNAIAYTGIRRVVMSGGIAMNVKAHKVLHELPEVESLFVAGSGSDESTAIGICYHIASQVYPDKIKPHSMYLGPDVDKRWVNSIRDIYSVRTVTPLEIAELLADGKVIGRMAGRMEFGHRALGNRSILADPRNRGMVDKINRKIKNRDFWMPFAPTVMDTSEDKYMVNPKGIKSHHMTIAFDSIDGMDLAATLHPADRTMRPQILAREDNPEYYDILREFHLRTGVGGVLNTSFNLHGEPIVCSPDDALDVFERSDIDILLVGDIAIKK